MITSRDVAVQYDVDGTTREALVFGPPPTTAVKSPLVFGFHGHGSNMESASSSMGFQTLWPEAVVVYPQGVTGRPSPVDPAGDHPGWQVESDQPGVANADLDFFDKMMATITQNHPVDRARVYATGMSNGAIFSYLLWAERGRELAALAVCAGRLWQCQHLTSARPLLAIAGEADTTDPYWMQLGAIGAARQINHATGPGQACGQYCTLYPSTRNAPVKAYIHPGAHVYPPWAPQEIVTFFKAHALG